MRENECSFQFSPSAPQFTVLFSLELIFQNALLRFTIQGTPSEVKCIFPGLRVNTKDRQPDPSFAHASNKENKTPTEMGFALTGKNCIQDDFMAEKKNKEQASSQTWLEAGLPLLKNISHILSTRHKFTFPQVLNEGHDSWLPSPLYHLFSSDHPLTEQSLGLGLGRQKVKKNRLLRKK